jgi:hypothetical protein
MNFIVKALQTVVGWGVWVLFWMREVAGWVLLVLGLFLFYECFALLLSQPPRIIQVVPLTVIGIFLFRGGIHMLKVSAAAQVCLRAQQQLDETREAANKPRVANSPTVLNVTAFELGSRGQKTA